MVHPFELVQHFSHMLLQAGHNKKRVSQIPALMQNVFLFFPPTNIYSGDMHAFLGCMMRSRARAFDAASP